MSLRTRIGLVVAGCCFLAKSGLLFSADIQTVSRVSTGSHPVTIANGNSVVMGMSSNGVRVVFASDASNLVTNDANSFVDLFVRDRAAAQTLLVSVNAAGDSAGNASSGVSVIAPDGSKVAFQSAASDLVTNDVNGFADIFLRDLDLGRTCLVSVNRDGTGSGNGVSSEPAVSADGQKVAFASLASDLVANDTNKLSDVFVRDIEKGITEVVSVNASGTGSGNGGSFSPSISADGRYVVFVSQSSDLVPDGTNVGCEVFVRDLQAGVTYWASTNATRFFSGLAKSVAYNPAMSADGRYVAFKAATISNSSRVYTFPVGLAGVLINIPRVRGVTALSRSASAKLQLG